jgi:competence protein ComEC
MKPNILSIITYYLLLFLSIYKRKFIIILLLLLIIYYNINDIRKEKYLLTLDVDEGDSLILKNDDKTILIDTGGKVNKNYSDNTITYLKSEGIRKIDYMILTHGDYDHMGEAINIINNYKVNNVILNCGTINDLEKDLIKELNNKKIKYYSCIKELKVNDMNLEFLNTKIYDNENDNSNVIYTELNNYKILLMGDSEANKEKDLIRKYNLANIDILKVGHHGSSTSSSKDFINNINPKYSIISVGKNNKYGHPNKEVLKNLKSSKIYRTDKDGTIGFKINKDNIKSSIYSP